MSNKIPYFYIIRHVQSGMLYAGCKFGADANPDNFMKPNGYQTSSKKIKSIIEHEGLESFEVADVILEEEIQIPFGWNSVYDYETWFLQSNNCAENKEWYNKHNNDICAYETIGFERLMLRKYGVTHNMQLPWCVDKMRKTKENKSQQEKDLIISKMVLAKQNWTIEEREHHNKTYSTAQKNITEETKRIKLNKMRKTISNRTPEQIANLKHRDGQIYDIQRRTEINESIRNTLLNKTSIEKSITLDKNKQTRENWTKEYREYVSDKLSNNTIKQFENMSEEQYRSFCKTRSLAAQGKSNPSYGKTYVNDGINSIRINSSDINEFMKIGFTHGKIGNKPYNKELSAELNDMISKRLLKV